jgi:hypothetical protein
MTQAKPPTAPAKKAAPAKAAPARRNGDDSLGRRRAGLDDAGGAAHAF